MTPVANADARLPAHPSLEASPADLGDPIADAPDRPLHVTRRGDLWRAGFEGSDEAVAVTATKAEALDQARTYAKKHDLDVIVHRTDGTIQKRFSA